MKNLKFIDYPEIFWTIYVSAFKYVIYCVSYLMVNLYAYTGAISKYFNIC